MSLLGSLKARLFPTSQFTTNQTPTKLISEIVRHNELMNSGAPLRPEVKAESANRVQVASTAYQNSIITRVTSNSNSNYYYNINKDIKNTENNLLNRVFTVANNQHKSRIDDHEAAAVRALQFKLVEKGYLQQFKLADGNTFYPRPNGSFNLATENAVKEFQKSLGLKATGIVDGRTWQALGFPVNVTSTRSTQSTQSAQSSPNQLNTAQQTQSDAGKVGAQFRDLHHDDNWSNYFKDFTEPAILVIQELEPIFSRDKLNMESFTIPDGYTPAQMEVDVYQPSGFIERLIFQFAISPQGISESHNNDISPVKTGGGYFINRRGQGLSRLSLSGYFIESKEVDERKTFLDRYYREYLVDKRAAFNDYFNRNVLSIKLEGYKYTGILVDLALSKSSSQLFTYQYQMQFLVTGIERMDK